MGVGDLVVDGCNDAEGGLRWRSFGEATECEVLGGHKVVYTSTDAGFLAIFAQGCKECCAVVRARGSSWM